MNQIFWDNLHIQKKYRLHATITLTRMKIYSTIPYQLPHVNIELVAEKEIDEGDYHGI